MAEVDYRAALSSLAQTAPTHIVAALQAAAGPLGAADLVIYVADVARQLLQPMPDGSPVGGPVRTELDIATSTAGRVYRSDQPAYIDTGSRGFRIWVPIDDHGGRAGVLELTLGSRPPEPDTVAACMELGRFAALALAAADRYTDIVRARQYGQAIQLSASLQWDLLPPLSARCGPFWVAGQLEPAYTVGGDVFDHATNTRWLDLAIFDAMGHGVASSQLATLTAGAYRHHRRQADDLDTIHAGIDEVLATLHGDAFTTGVLARIHPETGVLERTNAGHPLPLLVRDGKITELDCTVSLPFGFGGGCTGVATDQLQPGDRVAFYTDGVTDAHDPHGQHFGADRLAAALADAIHDDLDPPTAVRTMLDRVRAHQHGPLRDDATILILHWTNRTSS